MNARGCRDIDTAVGAYTGTTRRVRRDLATTSLTEVRELVRDVLGGRDRSLVGDAVLVVDELVSNALVHGDGPRTVRVSLVDRGRRVRIEVDDTSPGRPEIRSPDISGGRGLVLVDRLTIRWGVRRRARHKTVWAELAVGPVSAG